MHKKDPLVSKRSSTQLLLGVWVSLVAALFSMQAQALEVRHIVEAAVTNHPIMQGQRALRCNA